jgi:hypothetical protein
MTELTLKTLREEIDALRAELRALEDAHEALLARYERFTYMPPKLVAELRRGDRELREGDSA